MTTSAENCGKNMNSGCNNTKEGQRRASAQLLLPWVDEIPNTYTRDAHTVNIQRWVFDGYLMAERETTVLNAVKALQTPGNKGCRVFDGYLMGGGFASCRSPQKSLDKMTPNQPSFVKSSARQKRVKRREPLYLKGFPFDTNGVESAAICSLDWFIARS